MGETISCRSVGEVESGPSIFGRLESAAGYYIGNACGSRLHIRKGTADQRASKYGDKGTVQLSQYAVKASRLYFFHRREAHPVRGIIFNEMSGNGAAREKGCTISGLKTSIHGCHKIISLLYFDLTSKIKK